MSNEDQARRAAEAKLAEKGYVHPTSDNYSNNPQYMAYSNDNYVSQNYDVYASYNTEENEIKGSNQNSNQVKQSNRFKSTPKLCPVCEEKATYSCSCPMNDLMCKKGHIWYSLNNGKVVVGDPHEDD